MKKEDVIRMAREAGFAYSWSEAAGEALERFASLVAAAERAVVTLAAFQVAERQVAAEREACAEICACEAKRWGESPKLTLSVAEHWMKGYEEGANSSAEKIRARGQI